MKRCVVLIASCALTIGSAFADATFTTVYTFPGEAAKPTTAVLQASDGNFYGTTGDGGAIGAGAVYRVTPAGVVTTLYSFTNGADGSLPRAPLVAGADGNFYGTTVRGKSDPNAVYSGTIFKVTPTGTLTTLHTFSGVDGTAPSTELVLGNDGNFYGTVRTGKSGGLAGNGAVYSMTPSGTFNIIYSFQLTDDGDNPTAPLIKGGDGNFYGTTSTGLSTAGTVFKVTPGGTVTTVHKFTSSTDGSAPGKLIQGSDGNFYGTTESGGPNNGGTAFKLKPDGTFTVLRAFDTSSSGHPAGVALVEASDGNFYGTSESGGSNYGVVFQLTPAGAYNVLYSFTGDTDGASPLAPLIVGSDGNLYGTTSAGGVGGADASFRGSGTVFKVTLAGALTTLGRFAEAANGRDPESPLILASNGDLFGLGLQGGSNGYGAIFRRSAAGDFQVIYNFDIHKDLDKNVGTKGLVRANDGTFYVPEVHARPPLTGFGSILKISSAGVESFLYVFQGNGDGAGAAGRITIGPDGNIYGASGPDPSNFGTVFKLTTAGELTTLYSFHNGAEGANPQGGLVFLPDGRLVGATIASSQNSGVIFSIDSAGAETTMYRFQKGDDGIYANAPLTVGSDGNLYGTTQDGGVNRKGSFFKLTPDGTFTTLYSFTGGDDGSVPVADLIQASDGNFYGTTGFGGTQGSGTVFSVTPAGALTTLHSFDFHVDGESTIAPLTQVPDGSFYGVNSIDGPSSNGTMFHLVVSGVPPLPAPSQLLNISTRMLVLGGDNVLIGGFIVTGSADKKVMVRGLGPSLPVSGTLADPTLELHDSNGGVIASNDDWKEHQAEVEATTIPPTKDSESAIVATLPANNNKYTAVLSGKGADTGVGLVEVYDLDQAANSQLANISTRGFIDSGDNVMIGGLIVGGGGGPSRVIVRAIGPSLPVTGKLEDPTLELHDVNGVVLAANDDWKSDQQSEIEATTIPPANESESAIVRTLTPGNYTAVVRGKNGATGVGLVEAFNLQ
jgi:uncharacterized repeat protein (TIGR03803 family)